MTQWTVGEVRITAVDESVILLRGDRFLPGATLEELQSIDGLKEPYITPEGRLRMVIRAFLVETPHHRIIVDTCFGNDKPRTWSAAAMLQTDFLEKLAAAGGPRETIDVVLCTHLHVDHVGWNTMRDGDRWAPTFPNARYLFARTEFEHWQAQGSGDDQAVFQDSVQPVFDAGLVDLVETDHRIDAWVSLVPSIGHTPGHVCVAIQCGDDHALITGDSFHTPAQIARPDWATSADWDAAKGVETRRTILKGLAGTPSRMLGTHFPEPAAGRIVEHRGSYRFVPAAGELSGEQGPSAANPAKG